MDLTVQILLLLDNRRTSIRSSEVNDRIEETEPQVRANPTTGVEMADPFHMWFLTGGTAHNMPANTSRIMHMARERNDAAAAAREYATVRKGVKAELKSASKELKVAYRAKWGSKPKDKRRWLDAHSQQQGVTAVEVTAHGPQDDRPGAVGNEAVVAEEIQQLSREPSAASADNVDPEVRSADQRAAEQARLDLHISEVYERATRAMVDLRVILESLEGAQRGAQQSART